ncbi:hypothetical protein KKG83_00085 [Candidatus Micrarchaeota archaeon]|nr:hypothetical protein [Candidatus Micrarchaeota archaeon]
MELLSEAFQISLKLRDSLPEELLAKTIVSSLLKNGVNWETINNFGLGRIDISFGNSDRVNIRIFNLLGAPLKEARIFNCNVRYLAEGGYVSASFPEKFKNSDPSELSHLSYNWFKQNKFSALSLRLLGKSARFALLADCTPKELVADGYPQKEVNRAVAWLKKVKKRIALGK